MSKAILRIVAVCAASLSCVVQAESAASFERTASGVQYQIERTGKGRKAESGNLVVYSAVGSLEDGRVFLDTRAQDPPTVTVGAWARNIPAGLQEGLELLRQGDRAILVMPATLGYGEKGSKTLHVPSNATLRYEVEVLAVDSKRLGKVMKTAIDEGGIEGARKRIEQLQSTGFEDVRAAEPELNYLGYVYLSRQNRTQDAREIFEWNTKLYPQSANAWDSLAEAYLLEDRFAPALDCYRKALALDPLGSQAKQWKDRIIQLEMNPPALPALELMKLRMRFGRGQFEDESFLANLPMAVDVLQHRLQQYVDGAQPIEANDVATLVGQFFQVVERNRPELLMGAIGTFADSKNPSARQAALTKRAALEHSASK